MILQSQESRIRPMNTADIDRVIEVARTLPHAPQWPRDAYAAALNPDSVPRRVALVAEDAESADVVGFAVASLAPPEAELETIAVAAGFQRRGFARQLFQALADELRGLGMGVILLEVRASNARAHAFYRAAGFTAAGRRPRYYADPVEDAIVMRLALG